LFTPRGIALPDSEKAEAIADSLETELHPVIETSVPAFIEIIDAELRLYPMTPASEPKLTNNEGVQEVFTCLMVNNMPSPSRYV
jgi:hypothetical protein